MSTTTSSFVSGGKTSGESTTFLGYKRKKREKTRNNYVHCQTSKIHIIRIKEGVKNKCADLRTLKGTKQSKAKTGSALFLT